MQATQIKPNLTKPLSSLHPQQLKNLSIDKMTFNMSTIGKVYLQQFQSEFKHKIAQGQVISLRDVLCKRQNADICRAIVEVRQQVVELKSNRPNVQPIGRQILKMTEKQNMEPSFVQRISHMSFPNLKILKICGHIEVSSIQALSFLKAPKLKCLQIYSNTIVSTQALSKCSFPQLKVITIYDNLINNLCSLNRGRFKKLVEYQLDKFVQRRNSSRQKILQDYGFLFKMQNTKLKKLYAGSSSRIYSKNRQQSLYKLNTKAKRQINKPRQIIRLHEVITPLRRPMD